MVESTVVVTREGTAIFTRQPLNVSQFTFGKIGDKNMKAAIESSGNEGHAVTVGRKAWFNIDSAAAGQLVTLAVLDIQSPELDRVLQITGIDDPAAIRRPIRLIVISGTCRELLRNP